MDLKWQRYSLIRGPKLTKPGLIVTIYSVNIHAQKIFGLPHHNSKIWHFEILPQTPSFSWFRLPFFVAVKVTPIKKVHKIDPPKSTTHYSMNIFSDPPTPWCRQGCHLAVFRVAIFSDLKKIDTPSSEPSLAPRRAQTIARTSSALVIVFLESETVYLK